MAQMHKCVTVNATGRFDTQLEMDGNEEGSEILISVYSFLPSDIEAKALCWRSIPQLNMQCLDNSAESGE